MGQILESLARSPLRSRFNLNDTDLAYTKEKGIETLRNHAYDFITTRIAPPLPKNDGRQTPMKGHPVFVAQHATATCCRGCIRKWHGITEGRALTNEERGFIVDLIMEWIEGQMEVAL